MYFYKINLYFYLSLDVCTPDCSYVIGTVRNILPTYLPIQPGLSCLLDFCDGICNSGRRAYALA